MVYFFLPLTAALSVAPAVNLGALDALIFNGWPVCGLRPVRAPRLTTENFPNPVTATSSPFFKVFWTVLTKDSIARAESARLSPLSFAIASISSVLFICSPSLAKPSLNTKG